MWPTGSCVCRNRWSWLSDRHTVICTTLPGKTSKRKIVPSDACALWKLVTDHFQLSNHSQNGDTKLTYPRRLEGLFCGPPGSPHCWRRRGTSLVGLGRACKDKWDQKLNASLLRDDAAGSSHHMWRCSSVEQWVHTIVDKRSFLIWPAEPEEVILLVWPHSVTSEPNVLCKTFGFLKRSQSPDEQGSEERGENWPTFQDNLLQHGPLLNHTGKKSKWYLIGCDAPEIYTWGGAFLATTHWCGATFPPSLDIRPSERLVPFGTRTRPLIFNGTFQSWSSPTLMFQNNSISGNAIKHLFFHTNTKSHVCNCLWK